MPVTVADREAYKRGHLFALSSWEITEINAGKRDHIIQRWLDEKRAREEGR